jgi:alpha-1,3/alpha-1,6-mannosyltransferase
LAIHFCAQIFPYVLDIREIRLPLHPGDWFSQNIALSYHLIFKTSLKPDLIVVDHSASCVPLLKWYYPQCRILFYCHFPQQLVRQRINKINNTK